MQTIGTFNTDALGRCKDGHMDDIDRWLFIAQHAAFHNFADYKWIVDMKQLYDLFTDGKKSVLILKSNQYGFRRVLIAALFHIKKNYSESFQCDLTSLNLTSSEQRFLSFIDYFDRPFSRKTFDRFVSTFWEFTFISNRSKRQMAWFHLLFPSRGLITNIYRLKMSTSLLFFYPLNILIAGISSSLFGILYTFICIKNKIMYE